MVRADEAVLRKVLEGDNQYLVPLYQRPYQWTSTQWQTLWDDLLELVNDRKDNPNSSHFMGSLVLVPVDGAQNAVGVSRFLVVDGQQRLTTLTLLLAAIRDFHSDQNSGHGGERINNSFLTNQYEKSDLHIKLVPTQQDRDAYTAVIKKTAHIGGDDQIGTAYRFFRSKLENLKTEYGPEIISALENAVLMGLSVVSITTHAEDNVHRIFQSLNNTGLKLTQGDLIRNFIFMRLPNKGEDVYQRYWLPMQNVLPKNDSLEQLFWLDMLKSKPTLKINDTFSEYQKSLSNFATEEDIENEVSRLAKLAQQYALILTPENEEDPGVRFRLKRLKAWEATTPHGLILELLRRRESGEVTNAELERALLIIESYLVRRLIIGHSSTGLNRIFPQVLIQLNDFEPIDHQIHRLLSTGRRHFAPDDQLAKGVQENPFFHIGRASHRKLVISWLEESFGSKEPINTTKLSIEHIMPQTLNAKWRTGLSKTLGEDQVDEAHKASVHTLGNLTLTGYNSEMSNKEFALKKDALEKSGLSLTQTLKRFDSWGPEQITERGKMLTEQIIATWPGPLETERQTLDLSSLWTKVQTIVSSIPAGHWASYGDVAAAAGTNAQSIGNHLAEHPVLNAHRVLKRDGSVSDGFHWFNPEETRTAEEVLTEEGLRFNASRKADPAQRLEIAQLLSFFEAEDTAGDNLIF